MLLIYAPYYGVEPAPAGCSPCYHGEMRHRLPLSFTLAFSLTACATTGSPRPEQPKAAPPAQSEPPAHAYVHSGDQPHRFDDAEAWAKRFEDPSRDAWQKPDTVIAALALQADSVAAEVGSASGYFSVRIAPHVPQGRVWGVDIEPAMVRYLNQRARREGIANLFSILGTADDALLPEPVAAVLVVNTYHHIADRSAYFRRLAASLAPGGRLVIVDFKLGQLPVGPPDAMKVAPEVIERELAAAGYRRVARDDDSLPYQHLLVFEPVTP